MGYCVTLRDATFFIDHRKLAEYAEDEGYDSPKGYLEGAADESGWHFQFDRDGNVTDIDYGREKLGSSTVSLLDGLGKIIKAGSVVILAGEDGATMRFMFDGTRCKRTLTWGRSPEDDDDDDEDDEDGEDDEDDHEEDDDGEDHPYWGEPVT